jgi:hypothetical protein
MSGRTVICFAVSVSFVLSAVHSFARGRSFPIEITGTIIRFDRADQTFTIRADQPANVFKIAVRYDCKFKRSGVATGEQIMRPGAQVKVSYFATIFTGNLAVEIETDPVAEVKTGLIEKIDPLDRNIRVRLYDDPCDFALHWAVDARFLKDGKIVAPTALKTGAVVRLTYFSPAFASKYAVKVESK